MRYLTFATQDNPTAPRLGALREEIVVDLEEAMNWTRTANRLPGQPLPDSLFELIFAGPSEWEHARNVLYALEGENLPELKSAAGYPVGYHLDQVILFPPLVRPMSLRDFYAFETHVATANSIRGRAVPDNWYKFPVFYYSNTSSIFGPGEVVPYPAYTNKLDYELEVACVIGKTGINIPANQAEEYIFGYTILNDWSARDVQREEMKVGLGPAKGKDFATSMGPWIVTPDELADKAAGRPGVYDLSMTACVNGEKRSHGSWKEMHFSFGDMIARASDSVYLLPGDVISSGTVGTGCLLELTHGEGPWLQPGDEVELEVERLGMLSNRIARMKEGK